MKVLPFHSLMDPHRLDRFRREALAAAMLDHPHIVPVFGVGEHAGIHYYAMKFIEGRGLDEVLVELRGLHGPKSSIDENGDGPEPDELTTRLAGTFRRGPDERLQYFHQVAGLGLQVVEVPAGPGDQVVDPDDGPAVRQETIGEVRADEASRPEDGRATSRH